MSDRLARVARRALPFVLLAAAACGSSTKGSSPAPPGTTPPPGGDGGNTVTGNERIGWDQDLLPGSSPSEYTYSWFVDDVRSGSAVASCSTQSDTTLTCSAPIPKLTAGTHQLRLTSIRTAAGASLESGKSDALTVVQLGSATPALTPGAIAAAQEITGTRVPASASRDRGTSSPTRVAVVARGLAPVSDIAAAGDVVIVAERRGTLRLVQHASLLPDPALVLDDVIANAPGYGLLAVAAHPDFATNHQIYFVYTAETPGGVVYRLGRGREIDGQVGETAILLDGIEAGPSGWAALRFGPDRKLYAAFSGAPDTASRGGSYAGHVLRLNDDGTTPRDNARNTPVIADTGGIPLSLVWNDAGELGLVRAAPDGRREYRPSLARTLTEQPWRPNEQPAAAAYYHGDLMPELSGKLLVGMLDGGVAVMDGSVNAGSALRFAAAYGAARALAIPASGEIYIGTANGDLSTRAASPTHDDVLLRVKGIGQ